MARIERLRPEVRRKQILLTSLKLAQRGHYLDVSRKEVARVLDVTPPLINRYFPSTRDLQDAVYNEAVHRHVVEVIAQRIPPDGRLSAELRKKVKQYIERSL